MCSRYYIEKDDPEIEELTARMKASPLTGRWQQTDQVLAYGEVRPTNVVPVIAPDRRGEQAVFPMKWGYSGRSFLINARAETAGIKPTFREDWSRHRCIIPASWYYEWEHIRMDSGKVKTGDKYQIRPRDSKMTWLCGLYRMENGMPHFVILTREPGEEIRFIHDRMPLILPEERIGAWIRPDARPEEMLREALIDMRFEKAIE